MERSKGWITDRVEHILLSEQQFGLFDGVPNNELFERFPRELGADPALISVHAFVGAHELEPTMPARGRNRHRAPTRLGRPRTAMRSRHRHVAANTSL